MSNNLLTQFQSSVTQEVEGVRVVDSRRKGRLLIRFESGFGLSVINSGYGGDIGLFEVALVRFEEGSDNWEFAGHDIQGWLTEEDVVEQAQAAAQLRLPEAEDPFTLE